MGRNVLKTTNQKLNVGSATALFSSSKQQETVAVIGGGVAGLSCATFLASSGKFSPTVFDTGRLRPGGRCSSRLPEDTVKDGGGNMLPPPKASELRSTIIDHAAQILTVPEGYSYFQSQVEEWEKLGVLQRYPDGTVCNILRDNRGKKGKNEGDRGAFRLQVVNGKGKKAMYYGSEGMGSIPLAMASNSSLTMEQDVWVSPSNGVRYQEKSGTWKVSGNGKVYGNFDRVVIAHNGKCADRLMSKTPAKKVHSLLRVNFAPRVPDHGGNRMTLNSLYSLTFAFSSGDNAVSNVLPLEKFTCGFVRNEPTLRFLSCQSRKYDRENQSKNAAQVWTLISSAPFAKKHKAPQEFLPEEVQREVTALMFQALENSLCLPSGSVANSVAETRLQLWGAAVPVNVWASPLSESNGETTDEEVLGYIYDSKFSAGVCGDWLLEPSIAGAWESGRRLAKHMTSSTSTNGLKGSFRVSDGALKAGLGSFV